MTSSEWVLGNGCAHVTSWVDSISAIGDAINRTDDFSPESTDSRSDIEENTEVEERRRANHKGAIEPERIHQIEDNSIANIEHYSDGRQKTFLCGHIEDTRFGTFAPVQVHLSGATIVDSNYSIYTGPVTQIVLLIPNEDLLSLRSRRILDQNNIGIRETQGEEATHDFKQLRSRGVQVSSNLRDNLEQDTIEPFSSSDGFLAIDGTIPEFERILEKDDVVSIVKNHYARYLNYENENQMFNMDVGERTWLFCIERTSSFNVYSCYMRLREVGQNPLEGIVRVEIPPSREDDIDRICRRILKERYPVQRDITSWESQAYPFYVCEKAVNAVLPHRETIISGLQGAGVVT